MKFLVDMALSRKGTLSVNLKRQLFDQLSAEIGRRLKAAGTSEAEILADFKAWKKARRESRPLLAKLDSTGR